jgi:hypothetical protein
MSEVDRRPIQLDLELVRQLESTLAPGETLSEFVEKALKREIQRRNVNHEFLMKGLASAAHAKASHAYTPASVVIERLQRILLGRSTKKP